MKTALLAQARSLETIARELERAAAHAKTAAGHIRAADELLGETAKTHRKRARA